MYEGDNVHSVGGSEGGDSKDEKSPEGLVATREQEQRKKGKNKRNTVGKI